VNDQSKSAEPKDPRFEEALHEYLERVERGEPVDRDEFLARHAPIAEELRSFIAAEEDVRKLAAAGAETPQDRARDSTKSFVGHGQETVLPQSMVKANVLSGTRGLEGRFGRYRIIRALGKGAMGTVYLAEDTQIERQVALKTPHFTEDPTGEQMERFFREARAAGNLRHPNICPIYDFGQIDGRHFITMAYIEGRPLSAFIQPDNQQAERQILLLVRKLASALQEAHDQGVVHRDLKPANIMVDKKGEPIIMDFGLAQQTRRNEDVRLTQTGNILGTPAFMSPEQVEGEPDKIGPPADQYGLGVILYELLTGGLPFRGSLSAVMAQILTREPSPPSQLRPDLDARIEAVCLKMMAKNPAERFRSLKAVADEISSILKSPAAKTTSQEKPASSPAPSPAGDRMRADVGASQVLKSLKQKTLTERDLESLEELARKCYSRRDFEQVIQIIERVPEKRRSAALQTLLEKSRGKADEISFLICDIEEAERLNDRQKALKKADELLKIKPGHHRALKVQEQFAGSGKGGAARLGPLQQFRQPWSEGGWIPWSVLAFGVAAFGVMTAVIIIQINKTTIVIDSRVAGVEVTVKDKTITINAPGQETIRVDPGLQELQIRYAGLETKTKQFELKNGQSRTVKVWIANKELIAAVDGELLKPERPALTPNSAAAVPMGASKNDAQKSPVIAKEVPAEVKHPALLVAPFDAPAAKNARRQWADHLKRPGEVANVIGMTLALIPPGEFHMGSADPRMPNDARPVHRVRVTKPFYLGVYEVSQAEFQQIMGVNPSHFHDDPRLPVESITWDDVQKFIGKLNAMPEEKQAGRAYRLPTEAEWEYACRAGTETLFSFGDVITTNQANFDSQRRIQGWFDIPKGLRMGRSTRVGSYAPNAFGLYDMYGNVCEGVADLYSPKDYATSPVDDPKGPNSGTTGIARGGSWNDPATPSAYRVSGPRTIATSELGIRLACDVLPGGNGTAPNELASAATAGTSAPEGFVPLFNGQDLSGWHTDPSKPGNWRVEKGVLIGSGAKVSYLYSDRYNFQDFHLRVEARMNAGGNSGVYFRAKTGVLGYQSDIINPDETTARKTGTLTDEHEVLVTFLEPVAPPNQWFTMDVIAEGNHIVIQVNGKTTADYTDEKRRYTSGRIALQQARPQTVVEFRKVEIKELEVRKSITNIPSQTADGALTAPFDATRYLIVNGSFEEGPPLRKFVPLNPGSTAITGWTVTRGQIDYVGKDHWNAADGDRSIDLHGSPGYGGIKQTFKTTKGQRYRVTFSLAGSPQCNHPIKRIAVQAAGAKEVYTFDSTGKTWEKMGWVRRSFEFNAVSDETTLEIYTLEKRDPIAGPALDDVQVTEVPQKK